MKGNYMHSMNKKNCNFKLFVFLIVPHLLSV